MFMFLKFSDFFKYPDLKLKCNTNRT